MYTKVCNSSRQRRGKNLIKPNEFFRNGLSSAAHPAGRPLRNASGLHRRGGKTTIFSTLNSISGQMRDAKKRHRGINRWYKPCVNSRGARSRAGAHLILFWRLNFLVAPLCVMHYASIVSLLPISNQRHNSFCRSNMVELAADQLEIRPHGRCPKKQRSEMDEPTALAVKAINQILHAEKIRRYCTVSEFDV